MTIDLQRSGHVATIRISRPKKLNALSLSFWRERASAPSASGRT
jgi:enoyl-CoA hydratase/carnithine racemase